MATTWPLVGRDEELNLLERLMQDDRVAAVVLAGRAGVGKSRLTAELVAKAEGRGWVVHHVFATQAAASIPFGAVAHLLPPAEAGAVPVWMLLRAAVDEVGRKPGGAPVLIAVDDAHLLDDGSAAVVHQLAAEGRAFVVAAIRSGEAVPDAVTSLWKDRLGERIELQPLSRDEMTHLVRDALGGSVAPEALHRLWDVSHGNPLLVREVVLAAIHAGTLSQDVGQWRWKGAVPAAPRLQEIVHSRLAVLTDPERHALELLAVAGSLGLAALAAAVGAATCDALEERGLITVTRNGRRDEVRPAHPVYGEAIRATLPAGRVRTIRRQLADVVAPTGGRRREDLMRLATWELDGGGAMSAERLLTASRRSLALLEPGLAERLAAAAGAAGAGAAADLARAQALVGLGRFDEADGAFAAVRDRAEDVQERTTAAIAHAEHLFWRMGRTDEAFGVLRTEHAQQDHAEQREQIDGTLGGLMIFAGETQAGVDLLADIVDEPAASDAGRLRAIQAMGYGLVIAGRCDDATAAYDTAMRIALQGADDSWLALGWAKTSICVADLFAGRIEAAHEQAAVLYREALASGSAWHRGILAWPMAGTLRAAGRAEEALPYCREAVDQLREADLLHNLPVVLAELAYCHALLGEAENAVRCAQEAAASRIPTFRMDEVQVILAMAAAQAVQGDVAGAAATALRAADVAGELGQHGLESFALHDGTRYGAAQSTARRLAALSAKTQGRLVPLFSRYAAAADATRADDLEQVARELEDCGALLYAAEAWAEASRAHRADGRRSAELAATAAAQRLVQRCGTIVTPALSRMQDLPLTAREREIAGMAAAGMTSRAIAERLVVSVRTVDNHLQHVYDKLGIGGRQELAAVLGPGGAPSAAARG